MKSLLRYAGKRYVAGPLLKDALTCAGDLYERGFSSTLCFWDSGNDEPGGVATQYVDALAAIGATASNCYLSIKAPALHFCRELLDRVFQEARQKRIRVHFDSLAPAVACDTFSIIETHYREDGLSIGCTLPGRWRRSLRDADRAVDQGLYVRVVKGQWADSEIPDLDPREGFLKVIDRLNGRAKYVAVATHDHALADEAIRRLQECNTPCGIELLLGLPTRRILSVAYKWKSPVRFYVPYGHAWLPYALRQALRNPQIVFRLLSDALLRQAPQLPRHYPFA